jgi:uncharacterized protein YdhG (YjbR/CyaY superfamily)
MTGRAKAQSVDAYIAAFPPEVRAVLQRLRATVMEVVPEAIERISYGIPAFTLDGTLVYFAAFKRHIGVYPPVRGDAKLLRALAPYRGEKGNLAFPLDEPMPYALIKRVVRARVREQRAARAKPRTAVRRAGTRNAGAR